MTNPYLPRKAEIMDIVQETGSDLDVKTYRLKFSDGMGMDFMPGQFVEFSIPGVGEAPFGFASTPLEKSYIELSIKRVGKLTNALHSLKKGSKVWIRGPLGNTFPVKDIEGNDVFIVAGGLGLAPLRPLILYMFDERNRDKYGKVDMLIAARTPEDFIYMNEYESWKKIKNTDITLTIDNMVDGWKEKVGFPHNLIKEMDVPVKNSYAVLCGPPIMIKFVSNTLIEMGIPRERILTTLEMRMTCGVGKCGKCNIGNKYVCIDGPVFSMADLSEMPDEY
jgi:sulfhydrogenase subunit gamma (sulfur reductase)